MNKALDPREAADGLVNDGGRVALEGFSGPICGRARDHQARAQAFNAQPNGTEPFYERVIGMGCARKLVFSWGGNPGVGCLHRFGGGVEKGRPPELEIEEYSRGIAATCIGVGITLGIE